MTMKQTDIEKACQHFGLGVFESAQPVSGGLIHKMWQIKTSKGFFAIKELSRLIKFDEKTKNSYEESEKIARSFAKVGIPSISAISLHGQSLFETDGKFFLCYPWLLGKTLLTSEIKEHHRVKMARVLANIHHVSGLFGEKEIELVPSADLRELFKKVLSTGPSYRDLLMKYQVILLDIASLYAKAILTMPKKGLISHTDLDPKNVMWDDQQNPYLIDWESAQPVNPTKDLLQLAIDWSRSDEQSVDWNAFKIIINTFKDSGGVLDKSSVKDVLALILGNYLNWLSFNLRRSIDHESSEIDLSISQVSETIESMIYLYRSTGEIENSI